MLCGHWRFHGWSSRTIASIYNLTFGQVMTVTPGDYVPVPPPFTGPWAGERGDKDEVLTMNCTDFMRLPFAPNSLAMSFQRHDVCTSYEYWDRAHPDSPWGIGYDPPGVRIMGGAHHWSCCGACQLEIDGADILYFPTASPPSCSSTSATGALANSSIITARAAIEERDNSTESKFLVVDGSTL